MTIYRAVQRQVTIYRVAQMLFIHILVWITPSWPIFIFVNTSHIRTCSTALLPYVPTSPTCAPLPSSHMYLPHPPVSLSPPPICTYLTHLCPSPLPYMYLPLPHLLTHLCPSPLLPYAPTSPPPTCAPPPICTYLSLTYLCL